MIELYIKLIAEIVAIICFITSILDMGMNGAKYASWAPYGIGITLICMVIFGLI